MSFLRLNAVNIVPAIFQHPANLLAQGFESRTTTPEGLAQMIRRETAKWAKLVKESGAKVN